jgi:hypothetical protein
LVDFGVLEVGGEAEDADDFGGEDAGARFWEAAVFDFEALAVAEGLGLELVVLVSIGIGDRNLRCRWT